MENNIFNSFFTDIFVSPCVYKLIIYIYIIFSYLISPSQKRSIQRGIRTRRSLDACKKYELSNFAAMYAFNWKFLGSFSFTKLVHSIFLIFYNFHII